MSLYVVKLGNFYDTDLGVWPEALVLTDDRTKAARHDKATAEMCASSICAHGIPARIVRLTTRRSTDR